MKTAPCSNASPVQDRIPTTNSEWHTLDSKLHAYIKNCLYKYSVTLWVGDEQNLVDDVLQETYLRALCFAAKNASSIACFEALCKTIAKRYILDLRRKEKRFAGSLDNSAFTITYMITSTAVDPFELVLEDITYFSSILMFSQIIKKFPEKQRTAILIDLARNVDFDNECPGPLERAMYAVGIALREYDCPQPHDPVLRKRHNSLVCLAYKRLRLAFNNIMPQCNSAA